MKNLKNNKASGEDLIANEYLKHSFEIMSDIYVKLFNLIFDKGLIPEQWLYGDIIPIFKNKGDKSDPKNYRPITIVSCFEFEVSLLYCMRDLMFWYILKIILYIFPYI
jgi:hypothetical protein